MDRFSKLIIAIFAVAVLCLVLFLIPNPPGATPAPWNPSILWAAWAEGLKVLATLVAAVIGLYYGYTANILGSVRGPVKLIGYGCLFLTAGAAAELVMRIQGNDAEVLTWASILFAIGAILVIIALFSLPFRVGGPMSNRQQLVYGAVIVLLIGVTASIFVFHPESAKLELPEILTSVAYDVFILLIFIASIRLAILFWSGKMGRPFMLIATSGFLIGVYEYYVWMPFVHNLSIFNPIHILWIVGFLFTAIGIIDFEVKE